MLNRAPVLDTPAKESAVHATETEFMLPDGGPETVLVSAALLKISVSFFTFVEITRRIHAEKALKAANDKLKLLSRISQDHLHLHGMTR